MSFKYQNDVITDMHPTFSQDAAHLIAHYKFDGNYEDSNPQSTKYHLTNVDTELVVDGNIKSVLIDNDADELYTTDNMPAITSTSTYSWCCWIKRNEERHGANHCVFSQGVNGSTTEIAVVFVNNNTLRFFIYSYDLDITIAFNDTAVMSGYNHFVFTINNNTTKIYENGILRGSRSVSANIAANKLYIGKRAGASGSFRGNVADFRVYDKELSADEVYELYTLYNAQTPYSVTFPEDTECDILIVGGGGGGAAGGGGGGQVTYLQQQLNGEYIINVGKGGNGKNNEQADNGYNSSLTNINTDVSIISYGGGGGGGGGTRHDPKQPIYTGNVGSGGGSSHDSIISFASSTYTNFLNGNKGSISSRDSYGSPGGGGGAGGDALVHYDSGNPIDTTNNVMIADGGIGLQIPITGIPTYYGGGGAGGTNTAAGKNSTSVPKGGLGGGGDSTNLDNGRGTEGVPGTGGGGGGE